MDASSFPDTIDAKCCNCGFFWPYKKHEALSCPYCNAAFTAVEFSGSIAFFEGKSWERTLKDAAAAKPLTPAKPGE